MLEKGEARVFYYASSTFWIKLTKSNWAHFIAQFNSSFKAYPQRLDSDSNDYKVWYYPDLT
jgi:hypothetical protein